MHIVHRRQVIVVGIVRRPIDAVNLQILELILKVPGSSMSRRVLEQVSGHPFDTIWRPQLRLRTAKCRLLSSTPVPPIKYEQNTVFFSEVSNNDLPQSLDRESCPWSHLKQKQWSGYQSVGSRHDRERLKYKQKSTACPQTYPSRGTLSMSLRNVKYTAGTESALLFGNITDLNESK
jgi:hypothetical protein